MLVSDLWEGYDASYQLATGREGYTGPLLGGVLNCERARSLFYVAIPLPSRASRHATQDPQNANPTNALDQDGTNTLGETTGETAKYLACTTAKCSNMMLPARTHATAAHSL